MNKYIVMTCCFFIFVATQTKNDDSIFVEKKSETKKNKTTLADVKENCARAMKDTITVSMELQKTLLDEQERLLKKIEELVDEVEPNFFEDCTKEELEQITKKILDLQSFVQDATLDIEKKTYSIFKKSKK